MTKESGHIVSGWINTALSGVAVFLLIGVYNRFEKLVDKVDILQTNQTGLTITQDFINKKNTLIDVTLENQLKQANRLMDDLNDCDRRLDYIELYVNVGKSKAR